MMIEAIPNPARGGRSQSCLGQVTVTEGQRQQAKQHQKPQAESLCLSIEFSKHLLPRFIRSTFNKPNAKTIRNQKLTGSLSVPETPVLTLADCKKIRFRTIGFRLHCLKTTTKILDFPRGFRLPALRATARDVATRELLPASVRRGLLLRNSFGSGRECSVKTWIFEGGGCEQGLDSSVRRAGTERVPDCG